MHILSRRLRSFHCAFAGLGHVIRTQRNAQIHTAATAAVIALGVGLSLSARDWALIAAAIGAVWAAEIFNTAIEALVDLVSPGPHPLAGIAKDCAAAAVLITAITAVVIGLLVLGPPLIKVVHP
jgi:diacylglycerol kinase